MEQIVLESVTLDQMRVFVAIAEEGSFRKGAARVRRAQSAVSHAVANLELQLGVRLFDRSTHRPVLTTAGRALLEDARGVLLKVDVLRARARGFEQGLETELSMVVDTLFPLPVVAAAFKTLREAYPTVRLRLSVEPLGGPPAALRDRRCTLAVMAGEDFIDPRIERERLLSFPLVAVAAASHPLARSAARGASVTASELAEQVQVVLEDPTDLSEGRDFGVLSPQTLRVGTQDAKRALILAGVGWGRLPRWSIEAELDASALVPLPTANWGPGGEKVTDAYLAWRLDQSLGIAALHLRDLLRGASARR
jgi:DNA-binding transcriptional LysR family regulator